MAQAPPAPSPRRRAGDGARPAAGCRRGRVLVLHHAVRRQAAVALRQVHGAARQQHPDAETLGRRDLDIDAVLQTGRKDIVMIGRRRAAGQHQLGHRHGGGEIKRLRRQPRPDRIERLQPRKQFAVERGRKGARQRLVEMMMRVDEAGQHDMLARVEHPGDGRRRLRALADRLGNRAVLDHHAALGAVREDRQRILDPDCFAHFRLQPLSYAGLQGRDQNGVCRSARTPGIAAWT